jgi:hypothetical protein
MGCTSQLIPMKRAAKSSLFGPREALAKAWMAVAFILGQAIGSRPKRRRAARKKISRRSRRGTALRRGLALFVAALALPLLLGFDTEPMVQKTSKRETEYLRRTNQYRTELGWTFHYAVAAEAQAAGAATMPRQRFNQMSAAAEKLPPLAAKARRAVRRVGAPSPYLAFSDIAWTDVQRGTQSLRAMIGRAQQLQTKMFTEPEKRKQHKEKLGTLWGQWGSCKNDDGKRARWTSPKGNVYKQSIRGTICYLSELTQVEPRTLCAEKIWCYDFPLNNDEELNIPHIPGVRPDFAARADEPQS